MIIAARTVALNIIYEGILLKSCSDFSEMIGKLETAQNAKSCSKQKKKKKVARNRRSCEKVAEQLVESPLPRASIST